MKKTRCSGRKFELMVGLSLEEQTLDKFGEWHLPIVDIVSQSLALSFIGTLHSTFSLLSVWRVDGWNNGSTIYVPIM